MLEAIRIVLTAYTASFRVPGFIAHQLTLPVPPLPTIYGLISAAAGQWVLPEDIEWLAYRCEYEGKATDIEAIQVVDQPIPYRAPYTPKRNVLKREFLLLPRLTLYLPPQWEQLFRRPRYALLLGRTQDVASVESLTRVTLQPTDKGELRGVLLPLALTMQNSVSAWLQNLPVALTNEPRRRLRGVHIFGIVDAQQRPAKVEQAPNWLVQDTESGATMPIYRKEWIMNVIR